MSEISDPRVFGVFLQHHVHAMIAGSIRPSPILNLDMYKII